MKYKVYLVTIFLFLAKLHSYSQTGTLASPFTSLGLAVTVPSAGIYYFNLGGTTFNTYVDAAGYVLVAIDFGNGIGNLPQGSSLTTVARGIMSPAVLATLGSMTAVRITTSGGSNVTTSNATIRSKVLNNQTLHSGPADNVANSGWIGTNSVYFTGGASCTTASGTALHQNIFHPCGNGNTFHWIPSGDYQRDPWNSGEVSSGTNFRIWVRDNSSPLPIELIDFKGEIENKRIKLEWNTASESNNDYFTIERKTIKTEWEEVEKVIGAGNSSILINYIAWDRINVSAVYYYRLKQTDFDGQYNYSPIISINAEFRLSNSLIGSPNPCNDFIDLTANNVLIRDITVYNIIGENLTQMVSISQKGNSKLHLDTKNLQAGSYFVQTPLGIMKFEKQ